MRIIINADDLGENPNINEAIEEALAKGVITSSTILANSEYLDQVKKIVDKFPNASFGVHLNLTEGKSFTNDKVLLKYGIIDKNGMFTKIIHFKERPDEELCTAIRNEWDAQISHLEKCGFNLSHADGHHHCHVRIGLEKDLCEVLKKHNIRKVRIRNHTIKHSFSGYLLLCIAKLFNRNGVDICNTPIKLLKVIQSLQSSEAFISFVRKNGMICTDYFCSYMYMRKKCNGNKNKSIEYMCHPGHSRYSEEFQQIISDRNVIRKGNVLISYNDL